MPLLNEYALTPDVFDRASYSSEELAQIHFERLRDMLMEEAVVRNLRNGQWAQLLTSNDRSWYPRFKELLKKLGSQRRLRLFPVAKPDAPVSDHAWCEEALATHAMEALHGVICTRQVADAFSGQPVLASVDQLPKAAWWSARGSSFRLARTCDAYKQHLALLLQCANSIIFIDPYLDPAERRYNDFLQLILMLAGRNPMPLVQIHRVGYFSSSDKRNALPQKEWKERFSGWAELLQSHGIPLEVFIWDDFHDRYVITNLLGISVPYGFDTTRDVNNQPTTWTRLSRADRDDVLREFEPNALRHQRHCRIKLA